MEENSHDLGRRRHKRVGLDAYILATLTTDKDEAEQIFTTRDMSPEGIFLECKECFSVGTVLNLKIHTPSTLEPINAQAEVVRIAKDEKLATIGLGLVFIEMSENVRKELSKHLYLAYHYTGDKRKTM